MSLVGDVLVSRGMAVVSERPELHGGGTLHARGVTVPGPLGLDKERVVDAQRASKRKAVSKVKKMNPKKVKGKPKRKPLSPSNTPPWHRGHGRRVLVRRRERPRVALEFNG